MHAIDILAVWSDRHCQTQQDEWAARYRENLFTIKRFELNMHKKSQAGPPLRAKPFESDDKNSQVIDK